MDTAEKIEEVKEILKNKKIALGFSGGADSTLIAYLAKQVGSDVLAITYDTKIVPEGFVEFSKRRAKELGLKHVVVDGNYLNIEEFVQNRPSRCYLCRQAMYGKIKEIAQKEGYDTLVDGNNITDLTHDRPGILIKYKYDFLSPFIEARLETDEIRKYNDEHGIEYSNSTTCLATRIQTNEEVTDEKIKRIDYCEKHIQQLTGSELVQVRETNNIAMIGIRGLNTISDEIMNKVKEDIENKTNYNMVMYNDLPEYEDKLVQDYEIEENDTNYTLNKQLPYYININDTTQVIEDFINKGNNEIKDVNTDDDNINLLINNKKSKISEDGSIHIEDLENKNELMENFTLILPLIRRTNQKTL